MSAEIIYPLKNWEIRIRTTFDNQVFEEGRCKTVADLRKYFTIFKRRGEVWGYVLEKNRPMAWAGDDLIKQVKVVLEYTDQVATVRKEFDHVADLIDFLKRNAVMAAYLEYLPKAQPRTIEKITKPNSDY